MRKFDFAAGGWKYVSGYKMLIGKMGVSRDRNYQNTLRMVISTRENTKHLF